MPLERLEDRRMLALVQPAGQDYLMFEAEDPQGVISDVDADGFTWERIISAVGTSTVPSGGTALISRDNNTATAADDEGGVTYPIQLTAAGPYFLYVRTKYVGGGDNSMFVPADGGPIDAAPSVQWDNRADSIGNYHWNSQDLNGVVFDYTNPTPGAPTSLTFDIRENGYLIDKVILSQTERTPAQLDALMGQTVAAVNGPLAGQATVIFSQVAGATSYNVLRGTAAGGPFTPVGTAQPDATRFVDSTIPAGSTGQTFYYVVQPVTAGGPGAQSAPAPVLLGAGARASYYNDHFWGSGGRDNRLRSAGGIATFRAGEFADVTEFVPSIDYDWGTGTPNPVIRGDFHSTLFTGKLNLPADADGDGTPNEAIDVTFVNSSDDDGIIFVNGVEAANDMGPPGHGQQDRPGTPITLTEGQSYNFSVWQAEQGGGSGVRFKWLNPATAASEVIPGSLLSSVNDVPTAPTLGAGTVLPTTENERMVSFVATETSTSELWFELLRDGVVVGSAPLSYSDIDETTPGNQFRIVDAQPTPGAHSYTIRAANFDGKSAQSAPVSVTVPATYYADPANGASAYYFNSVSWNGGRVSDPGWGGGTRLDAAGNPDYGETVATVDFNYDAAGNSPVPSNADPLSPFPIQEESFSTVFTGEVLIPDDGDATPGETLSVQFVGNTDDHGIYYVNGQVAAISYIPRGQGDYTGAPAMALVEGQRYDFVILQSEQFGGAGVHFKWVNPVTGATEVIPNTNLFPRTGAPSAAPTGVSAAGTNDFIGVRFTDNATNEVRYDVERAEVTGTTVGPYSLVGYAGINGNSFTDRTAVSGRTYRYRVTAVNYEGRSASVETGNVSRTTIEPAPFAPTNGTAQFVFNRVNVQFTDNAINETNYVIQRRLASAPESAFAPIPGSPFVFNGPGQTGVITLQDADPTLVPGSTYVYRVVAFNRNGLPSTPPLDITTTAVPAFRTTITNALQPAAAWEVIRGDATMNYGWGGGRPDPAISPETFHVWTEGTYTAPVAGDYTFAIITDDGGRLFIDGQKVIDSWVLRGDTRDAAPPMTLTAGQVVELRFEMYEFGGGATARLLVTPPGGAEQPVVASGLPNPATPLRAPIDVTAAATVGDNITVHWNDTTANETGFQVLRGTDAAGPFTPIGTVGRDEQYFFDVRPEGATGDDTNTYFYQVRALNGATQGPLSTATADGVTRLGLAGGAVNFANFENQADRDQWVTNGAQATAGTAGFVQDDADGTGDVEGQWVLRLTDNVGNSWNAAYLAQPRHINGFTANYEFSMNPGTGDPADGMTFIIQQNDPTSPAALGGGGGAMGWNGLRNSFAVKFDNYPGQLNQIGVYQNGMDITDDASDPRNRNVPVSTFNFEAAQHFTVEMKYSDLAKNLAVTIDDVGNAATAPLTYNFNVDIPTMVGGLTGAGNPNGSATAYVGFTGATGGEAAEQDVFKFSYVPGEPSNPASISEVYVRGSGWSPAFKTYMEGQGLGDDVYGYRVDNKTADQRILPWVNMNEIVLRYSAPPTGAGIPTPGTVTLTGDRPGGNYTVTAVNQLDPQTFVLVLDRPLGNLSTGGENGVRVNMVVPGGGAAGANFSLVLNALQGDVNHVGESTHSVVAADFSDVKARFFRTTSQPGPAGPTQYTVFHDVDGSGGILANDFSFVKARFFDSLLTTPFPVAAAFSGTRIAEEVLG
jgi:hypothetical protein